jgi:hypothetical protein
MCRARMYCIVCFTLIYCYESELSAIGKIENADWKGATKV